MRTCIVLLLSAVLILLSVSAFAAIAPLPGDAGLLPSTGKYVVEVMEQGKWVEAARIGANKHLNNMHVDLSGFVRENSQVDTSTVPEVERGSHQIVSIPATVQVRLQPVNRAVRVSDAHRCLHQ